MVSGLMPSGHGKKLEFHVYILVADGSADVDAFVFQKYIHQPVTRNAFAFMIDLSYDSQELRLIWRYSAFLSLR